MRTFPAFGEFVKYLESIGELTRVSVEVDPYLEVTEIATRALREKMPAICFERVKGSQYPLVVNAFASDRRIEHALGRNPEQIGEELVRFIEKANPPSLSVLWKNRSLLKRFLSARARESTTGSSQDLISAPDLDELPIQVC
ncbi:MAG: hypothetical protein AAB330_03390, partial [Bacteroidota bacterium]